jgi:hypothetical protein
MGDLALFTGGTLLRAAATDAPDDRIREGILVPWDEPGRTNLGTGIKVRRSFAAALTPDAKVVGVYGHNTPGRQDAPTVSRLLAWEDRPEGLWGRIKVARTPLGDQLLAEIDDGARDGLSIESTNLQLDAEGHIVAGSLDFFAHVPVGAYDSARASALAAALHDDQGDSVSDPAPAATETAPAAPALDYTQLAAALAPHLTAAAAPAGLPTGALPAPAAAPAAEADPVRQLATLQAGQAQGDTTLTAALADITNSGLPLFQRPAGAIPQQLWSNVGYTRRFVPLLTQRPLTSYKFGGWEWTQRPEVGDWAGDKTQIPTNTVATTEIEGTAARIAGGWDIDRKFRDFGDAEFWTAFYAAQTESYARQTDAKAAAAIVAAAQDVTGTDPVARYTRPAGFGTVAAADDVIRAVLFGQAYLEETPLIEAGADYVLINTQDWLSLLNVTNLDLPAFLASMGGFSAGQLLRTNKVPAGSIVMGTRRALEWYELPGAAPIRVEALDVARGGIDSAVFGYWGTLHVRPGGIISVPLAAAGA